MSTRESTAEAADDVGRAADDVGRAADDVGRNESEEEREDRNLMELLQELRVAGIGVQVLFGFLLAMPFSARFSRLDADRRRLYFAVLILTAMATAQLSGPVAYHRIVFRRHEKGRLLRFANVMALTGLATVGTAICGAVALVSSLAVSGVIVPMGVAVTAGAFVLLWIVLPVRGRMARGTITPGIGRAPTGTGFR